MTTQLSLLERLNAGGVGANTLTALEGHIREKSYAQGDAVLRQGDSAPNVYYLRHGLAKLTYLTAEGKEFIKSFIDAGDFMGSMVSQMEGGPSTFSIICLEASTVESVPYALLSRLVEEDDTLLRLTSRLYQNLALKKEIREHDFLCLTPPERYAKFLEIQPDIARRVTQGDIAHYLGITPVALSRIKSRLGNPMGYHHDSPAD